MQKKNIYLWSNGITGKVLPILWFSAKTYYEEYGNKIDQWLWHEPFIHEWSDEKLFAYLKDNPPTIFGFSVYVWSYSKIKKLSKKISELYPDCLIIWGGPQISIKYENDFFTKHPEVKIVVPSDVYGEAILCHILDKFNNGKVKEVDIPEIYFQRSGMKLKSKIPFIKKDFVWPTNIFKAQKDYFHSDMANSLAIYESTRGCPYRCSYCDWGGGTFTKTIKKPLETVFSELEFLAEQKVEWFYFADANFGIFKDRDLQIIEYVAKLKERFGYPQIVNVENAKNNLERVLQIQEILIKNKLAPFYKISIQSVHDDVKKNIERVDIPFEEQYEKVKELQNKYDAPILIETILGLPGDSYKKTLETIEVLETKEIGSFRPAIWNLLPEAPAYDPVERKKWGIKTKWLKIITHPFRLKENKNIEGVTATFWDNDVLLENVIETKSYDRIEWCDMFVLTIISGTSKSIGLSKLVKYLNEEENIPIVEFYNSFYQNLVKKKKFLNKELNERIAGLPTMLYDLVDPDSPSTDFDINIGDFFPGYLSPNLFFIFSVMLHPSQFYKSIEMLMLPRVKDKEKLRDLTNYLINSFIDIDFDPKFGRKFNTQYNWFEYFENDKYQLTPSRYTFKVLDKHLKFVGSIDSEFSDYPEIDDYNQKVIQFFYHRAYNMPRPKFTNNLELVNDLNTSAKYHYDLVN